MRALRIWLWKRLWFLTLWVAPEDVRRIHNEVVNRGLYWAEQVRKKKE